MKSRGQRLRIRPKLVALAVAACFASEPAFANPTGPVVVNGQVTFGGAGSVLTVTNSPNSIINWQRFSIGAGETTRFIQQSAASAVLNRVVGADPSSILGALQSNGRVFLINPNGIIFGPGSQIDVAGLVASTLNISNEDFLGGRLNFAGDPAKAAAVVNQGRITASEGGRVYLVGSAVDNQGIISAPNGEVVLAAGSSVRVTDSPGSRLQVEITAPADSTVNLSEAVYGSRGIYGGLVRNSGTISANAAVRTADGRIVLKASKDVTLESTSVVSASGAQGGAVTAQADTGTLLVDGRVDATGSEAGGGTVQLLGEQVGLVNQAVVDTSGAAGGGTVNVGGSRQGEGPLPNSRAVFIGSDTRIAANATNAGDGGTVIVYADDVARIHGVLEAKGGPQGGNGGFVETSGKQYLDVTRLPDVTAGAGAGGEWLIDPFDITITTTVDQCNNLAGCAPGPDWTSSGTPAQLGVNLINNALNVGTSVTVTTGAGGAGLGNITFANNAAVAKTAGGDASLTVTAVNNITFSNNAATITSTSGQLDVNLTAGPGGITNLRAVNTNGGTLTLDSSGAITQTGGVVSGTGALVKNGTGTLTLSQANTYTGATTINAGTLALGNNNRIADASAVTVAAGATFELATFTETIGSLAGAGTVNKGGGTTDTLTVGGDNTSTTFSGVIQSPGGPLNLTKQGTGTLTLSGLNTYTGVTRVNAGVLSANSLADGGAASSIGASTNAAANLVLAGGTLEYTGATTSTDRNFTLINGTNSTVDVTNAATTLTISGASTAGSGALTKAGAGTLLLSGTNLYTGLTSVNAGTLRYGVNDALATGAVTVNDGGTYDLAGFSDSIGVLTVNSGATGGTVTTGTGTLTLTGNITSTGGAANASISGNLSFGATRTITTTNAADGLDISAVISGTGGLTKAGAGTLTLSGTNTYAGTTTISAGTLRLAGGDAIADAGVVTLANAVGATLDVNGTSETIGSLAGGGVNGGNVTLGAGTLTTGGNNVSTTYSGAISGAGAIVKEGTGTFTLAGTSDYDGVTTINAGTITATNAGALGSAAGGTTVNPGTTLALNGTLTWAEPVTLAGGTLSRAGGNPTLTGAVDLAADSVITAGAGTLTLSGDMSGAGGFSKTGGGILVLSGSNTYAGATDVSAGTVRVAGGNGIGDVSAVTMGGGTLDINGTTETIGSLDGTSNVTLGAGTLIAGGNNASTNYSGVISGAGGTLTKEGAGTLTLSGNNSYTGATNVNGGTLALGNNDRLANASALTVAPGATFDLAGFNETVGSIAGAGTITTTAGAGNITLTAGGDGTSTTFAGVIENPSGTLALTKAGAGTLTLSGANTYTGTTTVSAGTLQFAGGGSLEPTSAVVLVNGAGVTLDLNGTNQTIGSLAGGGGTGGVVTSSVPGAATLTTGGNDSSTIFAGSIQDGSGMVALTKAGSGTFTLTGTNTNTYTGATTVSAGTLALGNNDQIPDTSAVTVAAGAIFDLTSFSDTIGSLAGAGTVSKTGGGTDTLAVGGDNTSTTFSGVIENPAGALNLSKDGTGTLTLAGANTYAGTTTINAGTVRYGANDVIATGAVVVNDGATYDLAGFSDSIGALTVNSGVTGGTVTTGAGALTVTGNIDSTGGAANASISGNLVFDATRTITTSNAADGLDISAVINGAGGLTKAGAGTLTLSGANTFTGTTTVSAGTLQFAGGGALDPTNAVVLANTAGVMLDLNGTSQTIGSLAGGGGTGGVVTSSTAGAVTLTTGGDDSSTTFAGAIEDGSGTLSLTKVGSGTFTLSGSNTNTYTGATTVSAGTLALGNNDQIPDASAVTVAAGATFELASFSDTIGSLAGAGTVNKAGGGTDTLTAGGDNTSTTFSGVIQNAAGTLNLTKEGSGTFTLSAANTYNGTTAINAGTLVASNDNALGTTGGGTTVAGGATLEIANGIAIGTEALNLSGAGVGGNGALVVTSGTGSFGGNVTLDASASLGGNGNLTLSGTVEDVAAGTSVLTQAGTGTLIFANTVGTANALAGMTTSAGQTTALNGGSVRTTGSQTYGGTVTSSGATTLTSTAGGNITANNAANNFAGDLALSTSGAGSIVNSGALALGASSVGTLAAQALGGDLTLNGVITAAGAGDSIVLAAGGNFTNNAGAGALDPGAGRWLVYSTDPALDNRGGLAYSFKQYNAPFATAPAGAGNGFLYSVAPVITPSLTGAVTKVYDGTTAANLAAGNYALSGAIDGDIVTLNNPAAGTYDTKDVGTGKQITASGIAIASAINGGATVYGYQLSSTSASANIGDITPRALTVTAASDSKVYDATTSSAAAPTITAGSLAAGDTAGFTQTFDTRNVGVGKTLTAAGAVSDGNAGNNYAVTFVTDNTGVITPAALALNAVTDTKVYDGGTSSVGAPTATGLVGGDTVGSLTQSFASRNVLGLNGSTLNVDPGYVVNDGNAGANYTVTLNSVSGTITPRALTVMAASDTKVYDGTTGSAAVPTITAGSLAVGDSAGFTQTFDTRNVGVGKTLSAAGAVNDGNGGNNYAITYLTDNTGVITPRALTVTAASDSKVYDATTGSAAVPTITAGSLAAGDTAGFNQTFDTRNVGVGKTLTAAGAVSDGNAGSNYAVTFVTDNTGVITPASLALNAVTDTKVYDGGTSSAGTPTATGLMGGDTVTSLTQSFATKDVLGVNGSTLNVNGGYVVTDGNAGANYTVTLNSASGTITPAPLAITADDASRAQGAANPPFTATYNGFQSGETPAVLTGMLNFSTPAMVSSPAGLYPVTPFGQSSVNYAITYVDGVLTVTGGSPVLPGTVPVDGVTNLIVGGFEQLGIATNGRAASCSTSNQPNGVELMAGASGWAHWTCATVGK